MDEDDLGPWRDMAALQHLVELDLVTMKFSNVKALLTAVGPRLETLTLEMDEDQVWDAYVYHHFPFSLLYFRIRVTEARSSTSAGTALSSNHSACSSETRC